TGTLTPGGASVPLALTTPGQNGVLTMNATAGQVITVTASSSTIGSGTLRVLRPDGSTQIETPFATGTTTLADIPILTTGAYQVVVDPAADATGAVTIAAGLSTAVSGQKTTLGEQLRKIIRGKLLSSSTPYACPRHSP
ncbi:MAG: hypothetical protein ACKVPX_12100, partial [Myxococcaceae bacterium]